MGRLRENRESVISDYRSGLTLQQVADRYDAHRQGVWSLLRASGIETHPWSKYSSIRSTIGDLYRSGRTIDEIAKQTKVGNHIVANMLRADAVVMRPACCRSVDLTGQYFGRWLVLSQAESGINPGDKSKFARWNCRCECGVERIVKAGMLLSGRTQSCSCLHRERVTTATQESLYRRLFFDYKRRGVSAGHGFSLSMDAFRTLILQACHYCGAEPANESAPYHQCKVRGKYNGIDRVDNSLGYTEENSVTCCAICNRGKREMTRQQFLDWVDKVYSHQHSDNADIGVCWVVKQ